MRVCCHDGVIAAGIDRSDVGSRHHLEKTFFAGPSHVIAAVLLGLKKNAEIGASRVQHFGDLQGDALDTRIVRGVVPDKPENVDGTFPGVLDRKAQRLGPFGPLARWLTEGIAVALHVRERILKGARHAALLDKLPAQLVGQINPAQLHDDRQFRRIEGIINAMTPQERAGPDQIKASRKRRIAAGAGVQVQEVNRMLKQFEQMQQMMKMMKGGNLQRMMRNMKGFLPGMR